MGSFTNTTYTTTIDSLISAAESKLTNPYYKFSDKSPTTVNYYKQNKTKSTLDEASALHYAHVSTQSALKFNKIINFVLYGISQITVNYDVTDNGVESDPISGEAILLPNTIEPTPGDFFTISYVKEDLLFKVNSVTPDTLDTGAMIYKIEYQLELVNEISQIENQVVETYNFIADNVGTEFNCLITSENYTLASQLDSLIGELTDYFKSFFYKPKVQTFVYMYNNTYYFYDPYMIEFIRRNKILSNDNNFFYVAHQTTPSITFSYEYTRTFFYGLEKGDLSYFQTNPICTADLITDLNSLFINRLEEYYQVNYNDNKPYKTRFNLFNDKMFEGIKNNTKFTDSNSIFNLLTSYLNGDTGYITTDIINEIHKLDYKDNQTMFYLIPIYIFIIRNYINSNILSNSISTIDAESVTL